MNLTDLKLQDLQLQGLQHQGFSDPRLAVHAVGALPAWLWAADGSRVLWANASGAKALGVTNSAVLAARVFGPADPHRRQIAQLSRRLPESGAVRLERLRGFGAPLGMLATCGCSRIDLACGTQGVLITSTDSGAGRTLPLNERLQRLVESSDDALIAFTQEGAFAGASINGRSRFGCRGLAEAGLDAARIAALAKGRADAEFGDDHVALYRVGTGNQIGLVAVLTPAPVEVIEEQPIEPPPLDAPAAEASVAAEASTGDDTPADEPVAAAASDYENPALSNEAPAEFLLIDDAAPTVPEIEQPEPVNATAEATAADAPEPAPASDAEPAIPETSSVAPQGSDAAHPARTESRSADAPAADTTADDEPAGRPRRPLRFMWQMDAEGRFALGSDELTRLMGAQTAAGFGRPWQEIADAYGLDPEGKVAAAISTRETWSNVLVSWPVDGGARLPVELAGLPIFDAHRSFAGYRGFGVCRDLEALDRLEALRRAELVGAVTSAHAATTIAAVSAHSNHASARNKPAPAAILTGHATDAPTPPSPCDRALPDQTDAVAGNPVAGNLAAENLAAEDLEASGNVVPFRADGRLPMLTPGENSAFHELARQLSARLENEAAGVIVPASAAIAAAESAPVSTPTDPQQAQDAAATLAGDHLDQPEWLAAEPTPPQGDSKRDRVLFDLLPNGVLIYRLDRLLYANDAFLTQMGYAGLTALEQAGGLDALYVEPGVSNSSSTSDTGTPVTISAAEGSSKPGAAATARLFTITWDGDNAHALFFMPPPAAAVTEPAASNETTTPPVTAQPAPLVVAPPAAGQADAEDLGAILDVTSEGILMFDAGGNIHACNRSAEALFGYDGASLVKRNLIELFAPESARLVLDYLDSVREAGPSSVLDHGREVLGKVSQGGMIQLSITIGRTRIDGPNFFAVFRDLSQTRKGENELVQARRLADRAAGAKADMLARISHEVRAPLSAIIGFAEVMIAERFGPLGDERYIEYSKDIRASGERVIALIDDLLELSRIETGKLELSFTSQNLNELVESCVAVMQPQANRERIIIRTSLSHTLPPVVADARALRQIALNLISTSISLANAGGQVIVSTAMSDFGEVLLRVRDTGHGLNDQEVAAALEPFRPAAPSEHTNDNSRLNLSLTKALVEANRAQFHIKAAPKSGTLIEVVFSRALARTQGIG